MANFYAATDGLSGNSGTELSPWDIRTALTNGSQGSGDTLLVRGGTYFGKFRSTLAGGTVKAYPNEEVVFDGRVQTTLAENINSSATEFDLTDASIYEHIAGSDTAVAILIDGESIVFDPENISGNTVTNVSRGNTDSGTGQPAASHTAGASVYQKGVTFWVSGNNTQYENFIIRNSISDAIYRNLDTSIDQGRGNGLHDVGGGNKFINLIVHDHENGVFTSASSSNTLIYGLLVFNNGIRKTVSSIVEGHGHGMYLENSSGYSRVYNTLVLNSFNLGTQCFGVTGPYVGGDLQNSAWANTGRPLGATRPNDNNSNLLVGPDSSQIPTISISSCWFVHPIDKTGGGIWFGYGAGVEDGTISDCVFIGNGGILLECDNVNDVTVQNNRFYNVGTNQRCVRVKPATSFTWDNNAYFDTLGNDVFAVNGDADYDFADWKIQTGYDANSTESSSPPSDGVAIVPNIYAIGRATIYVLAASNPSSINVDLATTGLVDGQAYTIKNAFDYFGDNVATGVYDAGSTTISLPLNGAAVDVATPYGNNHTPETTLPHFGVFIVIPLAADASAPGTPTGLTANIGQSSGATGTFQLAWTLGSGTETSVTVRRIVNGVTTDIPLAADVTSYTDTGQTVGLSYTYAVKASNASGDSAWSDAVQEVLTGLTCFGAPPSIG